MRRYDALEAMSGMVPEQGLTVTNLANTATEWRALHARPGNLYFVGMGMVTPYATGLALALPHRHVLALDGDGGLLFDLSVLGTISETAPPNLCILVFDNEGYISTGKLPTVASQTHKGLSLAAMARAAGLERVTTVDTVQGVVDAYTDAIDAPGPSVIIAKVDTEQAFVGSASLLDPKENKYQFARHVEATENVTIIRPSAKEHGAPPPPDPATTPVSAKTPIAEVVYDGLKESKVDFVVGVPCSGLVGAQELCQQDDDIRYVGVANEGTGIGLCVGAWLGGKRPAALIENFGLFASTYQLLRGNLTFGVPLLMVVEYRGDAGEQEFFGELGEVTEPLLSAARLNGHVVRDIESVKPAIRDGLRWTHFALRPYTVLLGFDLTRPRA